MIRFVEYVNEICNCNPLSYHDNLTLSAWLSIRRHLREIQIDISGQLPSERPSSRRSRSKGIGKSRTESYATGDGNVSACPIRSLYL